MLMLTPFPILGDACYDIIHEITIIYGQLQLNFIFTFSHDGKLIIQVLGLAVNFALAELRPLVLSCGFVAAAVAEKSF